MNYNDFANNIKAKYPDYADIDNRELAESIINKYPEYKEQVTFDDIPTKQKVRSEYTRPNQDIKNMSAEEFKNNVDTLYNIPQADIPQRGELSNSDGETKILQGEIKKYNQSPNPLRNALRQAGRNTARFLMPKKAENWFLGSKEDEEFLKKNNDDNVLSFEDARALYDQGSMSKEELLKNIELNAKLKNLQADADYRDVRNKNIGKGIVDIGTAFIPIGGGGAIAAKGASLLKPVLGKRIAAGLANGATVGAKAGAIHGVASGIVDEDINPLVAGVQEGLGGSVFGGALGLGGEKIVQGINARRLKNLKDAKTLRKAETDYYKDYIQQTSVKRSDLGNIDFTQAGLETVSKQPEAARQFNTLKKDIKNASYVREELPKHPRNDDIVKFHRLEKDNKEFLIGETAEGKKYYMSQLKDGTGKRPSGVVPEPSILTFEDLTAHAEDTSKATNNIIDDVNGNINPSITKSEEVKNISKKELANSKRDFKQGIKDLSVEESPSTYITLSKRGHFWKKNITDPYTQASQEAEKELNSVLKEIKEHPEFTENLEKMQAYEARLDGKFKYLYDEHAEDFWGKFYQSIEKADEFNKTNTSYNALANRQTKTRGAVDTVERKVNTDVANAITDREYLTRGYNVNKAQLDRLPPEELQKLINSDELSDLSITAKAIDINKDLENGQIPLYKLNKWVSEGTPIGQAMQARSLLNLSTPEGAIAKMINVINEASPKVAQNLKNETGNIVKNIDNATSINEIEKLLSKTMTNAKERKTFAEKLLKLKQAGGLNEDNFIKLVDKHFKLPEITDIDVKEINKLTSNLQNAQTDYDKKVAEELINKYIVDKLPKKFLDKVNAYRYQNMLLSPKSRIKDSLLTGLNAADTAIDEGIANLIDGVRSGLTGSEKVFGGLHSQAWLEGLKRGFKEGVNDVKLGINTTRTGEKARYGLPKSNSFDFKPIKGQGIKAIPNILNNILAGGEKALNYSIRVPDRMFYEARYNSSLADQLKANNLKEATDDIIAQAVKEAKEAVYQDDSWVNRMGLGIRNFLNTPSINFNNYVGKDVLPKLGDWIEPFVTTPANIANQGLKNTLGGTVGVGKILSNPNLTREELRDAEMLIAKNLKGLLPLSVGWGIGKNAIESNIGDNNYQANEISGLKPQSIAIGDKAFSLKDYPQWSIPMAVGQGLSNGGITQAAINAGKSLSDMSSLKSLGELVGTIQSGYGQEKSFDEILDDIVRTQGVNAISQLIPYGGSLGELRNDIDPYARELYTPNTLEYIGNRLQNRLPVASTYLPQKFNAIGEPVMANNINNLIGRVASEMFDFGVRNYNKDEVYNQLNKFKNDIKDSDIKGKTKVGFDKVKRKININGEPINLNNEQYSQYQKEYGKINYIVKSQALNSEEYKNFTDEEKTEYLNDVRNSVDQAVKMRLFGLEPKKINKYTEWVLENYDDFIK